MKNAELIDSLRNVYGEKADCYHCHSNMGCYGTACMEYLCHDAADALEADEQRIAELSLDCELFQQKCMELDAQLPKEGEWIYTPLERYQEYKVKCPFCGAEYHDCYDGYIDAKDMNYCPNCGARMDGERKDGADDGRVG